MINVHRFSPSYLGSSDLLIVICFGFYSFYYLSSSIEENINATTVPEINISGVPLVNVPAGYYESGSPFSLAFFGEPWSEAELIGMAYDYEQSTEYREAPQLTVEEEETTTGGELPETATNYAMYVLSVYFSRVSV